MNRVSERVKRHLDDLHWTQKHLAERAGINESDISQLLNGKRDFHPSHLNRIAVAIARGYDAHEHSDHDGLGLDNLHGLINQFLVDAGFSAITGREKNVIWARLLKGRRQLKVGWVHYYPFSYLTSPAGAGTPVGLAADVMKHVAELMGAEISWHPLNWGDIIPALVQRQIDLILPILLVLPTRMFQIQFSETLPDLSIPVNGLVHKKFRSRIFLRPNHDINTDSLVIGYVEGEAGQDLCTMFAPMAPASTAYTSAPEACNDILQRPLDSDAKRVRCLVADHTICLNLQTQHKQDLALVYDPYPDGKVRLPLAAGLHLEEVKLLPIINRCINTLKDTGYFIRLYDQMNTQLSTLGILHPLPNGHKSKAQSK
jgi:transcriptional regulator with XRE-family HTH domain